jgi:site-specific recombinase XerD
MFDAPMAIRDLYYWALENVTIEDDTAFYVHNPKTMDPKLAEFFSYDAAQVFETWKHDTGIQYLMLDKSPRGTPGTILVVGIDAHQ